MRELLLRFAQSDACIKWIQVETMPSMDKEIKANDSQLGLSKKLSVI